VLAHWRRAADPLKYWSRHDANRTAGVEWLGLQMDAADALAAGAFENWIHRDDLRRVRGQASAPPAAAEIHVMASLSMRTLPDALASIGRAHPGRTGSIVLTGAGGGRWLISLGPGSARSNDTLP
jgi:hypothetical protein